MGSAQLSPVRLGAEVLNLHGKYGRFWTSLIQIHPPSFQQYRPRRDILTQKLHLARGI